MRTVEQITSDFEFMFKKSTDPETKALVEKIAKLFRDLGNDYRCEIFLAAKDIENRLAGF